VAYLKAVLTAILLPLLPGRYRKMWPWPAPWGPAVLDHASAYAHIVGALVAWGIVFVLYQKAYAEKVSEALAETDAAPGAVTWLGAVTFFSFFFSAQGLLLTVAVFDGAARFIHVLATGEPMGSLFLALPLLLVDAVRLGVDKTRMTALYGREGEPDRMTPVGDGLLLKANRPHGAWHRHLTFASGERFYRLDSVGEGRDGDRRCFEYRFRPWIENEPIRSIVRLDGGAEREGGPVGPAAGEE
jgi:hypothetical protein